MSNIPDTKPIRVEIDYHQGYFDLSDDPGPDPRERFQPMFERLMDREWAGVTWKDDAGNAIHLPFCRATEKFTASRIDIIFTVGMKRTFTDGRPPNDALCARIHASTELKRTARWNLDVEDLGGALMRLMYCEVLRLIAWLHPTIEAELHRCEALLTSDQATITAHNAATTPATLPPITDPIDQDIYLIIVAADFEITDEEISARLFTDYKVKLTRSRINFRRNKLKAMGWRTRS